MEEGKERVKEEEIKVFDFPLPLTVLTSLSPSLSSSPFSPRSSLI
jgi:hypothetical protein